MLLVADETVANEQFTQIVGGTVEHRTTGEGLIHLQMVLFAMSLMNDIEDVEHVEDNAPSPLVLENDLWGPVETFGVLSLELLDIIVSLDVFLTETPDCVCVGVIKRGFFKDVIITPVSEDVDDIVVLFDGLDGLEFPQFFG